YAYYMQFESDGQGLQFAENFDPNVPDASDDARVLLSLIDAQAEALRTAHERIAALEAALDAMRRAAEDYAAKWRNELLGNVQDSIDLPEQPYEAAAANRLLAERATELGWLPLPAEPPAQAKDVTP